MERNIGQSSKKAHSSLSQIWDWGGGLTFRATTLNILPKLKPRTQMAKSKPKPQSNWEIVVRYKYYCLNPVWQKQFCQKEWKIQMRKAERDISPKNCSCNWSQKCFAQVFIQGVITFAPNRCLPFCLINLCVKYKILCTFKCSFMFFTFKAYSWNEIEKSRLSQYQFQVVTL